MRKLVTVILSSTLLFGANAYAQSGGNGQPSGLAKLGAAATRYVNDSNAPAASASRNNGNGQGNGNGNGQGNGQGNGHDHHDHDGDGPGHGHGCIKGNYKWCPASP